MLRYSCRLGKGDTLTKIPFKELFISHDLTYITGTTDSNITVGSTNTVILKKSYETSECNIKWSEHLRQGLCFVDTTFKVETYNKDSINIQYVYYNNDFCYVQQDDNGKYIVLPYYNDIVVDEESELNPYKYIENYKVYLTNDTTVNIKVPFWIEDGTIEYHGVKYLIETDSDKNSYVVKGDDTGYFSDVSVHFFKKEDFFKVKKFRIERPENQFLQVETITGGEYSLFCAYENKKYYITKIYDNGTSKIGCYVNLMRMDNNGQKTFSKTWADAFLINYTDSNNSRIPLTGDTATNTDINKLRARDIFVELDGTVYPFHEQLINSHNTEQVIVYVYNDRHSLNINDTYFLSFSSDREFDLPLFESTSGKRYVLYENEKYWIDNRCCDTAIINGEEFNIYYPNGYEDGSIAYVDVYDVKLEGEITDNGTTFKRLYNIPNGREYSNISYHIKHYDGVVIGNERYVIDKNGQRTTIKMNGRGRIRMRVIDKAGSSALVCIPDLDKDVFSKEEYNTIINYLNHLLIENKHTYLIETESKIFGDRKITVELPWVGSNINNNINTSQDYYNLNDKLSIFGHSYFCRLTLPLTYTNGGNPLHDDISENQFFTSERRNVITNIVDMEKEVYYPVYPLIGENGNIQLDKNGFQMFKSVRTMEFNLHFRTRDEESWKIIEDEGESSINHDNSNWFITDYEPYKHLLESDGEKLQESSDLLGLMYFTNNDVYYQKDKLAKSFLRLSFYDSINPLTQNLLATSTIFFDESKAFKKYMNNMTKISKDIMYDNVDKDVNSFTHNISVKTEVCYSENKDKLTYKWDDEGRLSSRFSVHNKHENDNSSEGFYIYMFRDYATSLHPEKIFMKVEFNHAGLGKILTFNIPTSLDGHVLRLNNENDLNELKSGVSLKDVYKQTYIPLTAVYDNINKRYSYYVNTNYISPEVIKSKGDKLQFNLFEMKIKNED